LLGVPSGTPPGEAVSTEVWLTESIDRALHRNFQSGDVDTIIAYLIKRSMVSDMVAWDYNNAPWVLTHIDLHGGNIIVDKEFNIKG
jgi:hypothetical protein